MSECMQGNLGADFLGESTITMELGRRGRQSGKGAVTRRLEDRARGREAVDSDPGNRFNDIGSTTSFTQPPQHC